MHLLLSTEAILIKNDYALVYEENIIKFHKVDIQHSTKMLKVTFKRYTK